MGALRRRRACAHAAARVLCVCAAVRFLVTPASIYCHQCAGVLSGVGRNHALLTTIWAVRCTAPLASTARRHPAPSRIFCGPLPHPM